jgi:hypothetical protein
LLHLGTESDQVFDRRLKNFESMRSAVCVKVERPTKGDVAFDRSERRSLDGNVSLPNERRHIDEANVAGVLAIPLNECFDEAARRVDADTRLGNLALNPA